MKHYKDHNNVIIEMSFIVAAIRMLINRYFERDGKDIVVLKTSIDHTNFIKRQINFQVEGDATVPY